MVTPVTLLVSVLFSLIGEIQELLDRYARMTGGWYTRLEFKNIILEINYDRVISIPIPDHMVIRGLTINDIQIIKDRVFDTNTLC
jgi:hypothetical protein